MTITQAIQEVRQGIIPGVRGPGAAAILMQDGRKYSVSMPRWGNETLLERFSGDGELLERATAAEVAGEVDGVTWTCDELGGVYIS